MVVDDCAGALCGRRLQGFRSLADSEKAMLAASMIENAAKGIAIYDRKVSCPSALRASQPPRSFVPLSLPGLEQHVAHTEPAQKSCHGSGSAIRNRRRGVIRN
jgi:hypothetical protein